LSTIDANLDDLQAGIEASSRVATRLRAESSKWNGALAGAVTRSIERHVADLIACADDQRAVLENLRQALARGPEDGDRQRRAPASSSRRR
jgi:hypothetical protein